MGFVDKINALVKLETYIFYQISGERHVDEKIHKRTDKLHFNAFATAVVRRSKL